MTRLMIVAFVCGALTGCFQVVSPRCDSERWSVPDCEYLEKVHGVRAWF